MTNGWYESAAAWIEGQGMAGDWARRYVLDPVMLAQVDGARIDGRKFTNALDVGCGEGWFCRMLRSRGLATIGIDPVAPLIEEARRRDPEGDYRIGGAEALAFADASFDLVVSYLTLIDIDDHARAIAEMARVLAPGGMVLIANLASFMTAAAQADGTAWRKDAAGRHRHVALDHYLEARAQWVEWDGIRVRNWHRPLSAYMHALLASGLRLSFFDEPRAQADGGAKAGVYDRAPYAMIMAWRKA